MACSRGNHHRGGDRGRAWVGGIIYKNKHDEAYARCQTAVSEFSEARKALLDTTSDSPALQKLVRNALGVDKILDAAADAASAAEGTVHSRGVRRTRRSYSSISWRTR